MPMAYTCRVFRGRARWEDAIPGWRFSYGNECWHTEDMQNLPWVLKCIRPKIACKASPGGGK